MVCLLLLGHWCSLHIATPEKAPPVSLAATLKKADPRRGSRWASLAFLVALLGARGVFYWNVGDSDKLDAQSPPRHGELAFPQRLFLAHPAVFRAEFRAGAGGALRVDTPGFVINRRVAQDEPVQRLVRLQLGWIERSPPVLKLLTPVLVTSVLWGLASPGLVNLGILPAPLSSAHLWEQALLLGFYSLLSWKFLSSPICLLYMLNSYVYLGRSAFWDYVNLTGANLLRPLRHIPMCLESSILRQCWLSCSSCWPRTGRGNGCPGSFKGCR